MSHRTCLPAGSKNCAQVLLHDPSERPQVSDFGFAVAPGTHNLVVVEKQVTVNLEPPYGECESTAMPRSHCLAGCQAEHIWLHCHCRDVYMSQTVDDDDDGKTRLFVTV